MRVLIEVSPGELVDKITILEVKRDRITDQTQLAHVRTELQFLERRYHDLLTQVRKIGVDEQIVRLKSQLRSVNELIWDGVGLQWEHEVRRDYGHNFMCAARSVYIENDRRSQLKREIDQLLNADFQEQKCYAQP